MNIDIRKSIINNFKGSRNEEITEKEYLDWKAKYPQNQNDI